MIAREEIVSGITLVGLQQALLQDTLTPGRPEEFPAIPEVRCREAASAGCRLSGLLLLRGPTVP